MKVKELIEKLQKFNPDTMVVVSGYECGFDELIEVSEIKISLNVNFESWEGKHDSYDSSKTQAIYLC